MGTLTWQNISKIHVGQVGRVGWFHMEWPLYSKYDQASDLLKEPELASELESDLQDTWTGNTFMIVQGKNKLVLIDQPNNTGAVDVKLMYMFIKKGKFFKVLRYFINLLQYYPKLNNGQHTKLSNLCLFYKISNFNNFVTTFF